MNWPFTVEHSFRSMAAPHQVCWGWSSLP